MSDNITATRTSEGAEVRVLVVDDEDDILDLLEYNLRKEGFTVDIARDGIEALEKANANTPDMIILDVMMPHMDGMEFCSTIRNNAVLRSTPILMLTAKSGEQDHVAGLEVGADIYLTKPISVPVLLSQTKALLRSSSRYENPPDRLTIDDLEIDRDRFRVFKHSEDGTQELRLPRKEFEVLYCLACKPGVVFSREELLDIVWGTDVYVVHRTVDVHVRKIREKIGDTYIETVKGVGYRFRE